MKPSRKPAHHDTTAQPAPLPEDTLVNVLPALPEDMVALPGELPSKPLQDGSEDPTVGQIDLPTLPVDSRLAHLQNLVMQMDTAVAGQEIPAVGQETALAVTDVEGRKTALSEITQAMFTTRQNTRAGAGGPPTAAALAKNVSQVVIPNNKEQAEPVALLVPTKVEESEQLATMFKPVDMPAATGERSSSFVPVASVTHTTPTMQQASHATATPVTTLPAPVLTQELGSPAWQQALSQQVSMFTRNGIHNAEIRLNPAELGVIKINLRMNSDQANLHFVSENHQVRAVLEAAMPQLRTSLAESGINLNAGSVGSDSAQSWDGSSHYNEAHGQASRDDKMSDDRHVAEDDREVHSPVIRLNSGINTFA
ncbi:hypothetical protein EYY94_12145 [Obesumbacterium proteus]|nr:hypothetical protein EYY94_12145 [Obesumbacterium proteus]